MPQPGGRSLEDATLDSELVWSDTAGTDSSSGSDTALSDLAAAKRRIRHRAACEFLATLHQDDIENAKTLKDHDVATGFSDNRFAFAKAGRPSWRPW